MTQHSCKISPLCDLGGNTRPGNIVQFTGNNLLNIMKVQEGVPTPQLMIAPSPGQYDLMIIEEVPSFETLKTKRDTPYLSEAGRLISELVLKAGLDPAKIYVTYQTKCCPPVKQKPSVSEINICRQHLDYEMRIVQPKVVMPLGNSALRVFNLHGKGGIQVQRGNIYKKHWMNWEDGPEFTIVPSLKPSNYLVTGNQDVKNLLLNDLRLVKRILSDSQVQKEPTKVKFNVIENIEQFKDLVKQIKEEKIFSFDTEFRRLEWWQEPLLTIQFSLGVDKNWILPWYRTCSYDDPNKVMVTDWRIKDCWTQTQKQELISLLQTVMGDESIAKIAHNFKIDLLVLKHNLNINIQGFLYDTMVMHHLLWEIKPHSLDILADIELDCGDYELPIRNIVGHGKVKKPYDLIPNDILWQYGANDAQFTWQLCQIYFKRLQTKPHLWKLYIEESQPNIKALADAEYVGFLIDEDVAKRQIELYNKENEQIELKLKQLTWPEFKPTIRDDVIKALISRGHKEGIIDENSKSKYKVDKDKLIQIDDPVAQLVLKHRQNMKLVSTYFKSIINERDNSGRFHPSFMQFGTETGRLSAKRVHQIPRLDENKTKAGIEQPRHMFIVEDGYVYVHADYSQLELYIMAIIAKDETMLKAVADDLHAWTAALFLDQDLKEFKQSNYFKFNRSNIGKRVNFGLQYGSEGYQLVQQGTWMNEKGIEKKFTQSMYEQGEQRWRETFYNVGKFMQEAPEIVRLNKGIAVTVFGRQRHFVSKLNHTNVYIRRRAERELINFLISSPAASITNRTISIVYSILEKYKRSRHLKPDDINLLNTVHDSLGYRVRKHLVDWFIHEVLLLVATRPVPELDNFKFKVDYGIGSSWAEAELNS